MAQCCKNICKTSQEFRTASLSGNHSKLESAAWPICRTCNIRIQWSGRLCPCCVLPLSRRTRVKPVIKCKMGARRHA